MRALVFALALLWAVPAVAEQDADALAETLLLEDVVGILRDEGLDYAADIEAEMLPGGGGQFWDRTVARLYAAEAMRVSLTAALEREMSSDEIAASVSFLATEAGQAILTLENAAREAMADPAVEAAALEAYQDMQTQDAPLIAQIAEFVRVNDLLERNVAGALSSNYQFFRGLADGGAYDIGDAEILADVWGQEAEVRAETESWLNAFLILAYQPLEPQVLESYIAFSDTDAGRALNAALFEGFEAMYRDISYGLGLAVAQASQASDL